MKKIRRIYIILFVLCASFITIIFSWDKAYQKSKLKVIHLTAVSSDGVWTRQEVNNRNYWRSPKKLSFKEIGKRHFTPATIITKQGDAVKLRLKSFDVKHGFYIPELGIGPFHIKKGRIKEVIIDTKKYKPGVYTYYCMNTRCSDLHFWMRGYFVIYPKDGKFKKPKKVIDWNSMVPQKGELFSIPSKPSLGKGKKLFQVKGCMSCHNRGAKGGIKNFNYVKRSVPKLNNRAEKMMLFEKWEGQKVIDVLSKGEDLTLDELNEIEVVRPSVTFAQYQNMKEVIKEGKHRLGKKNPKGPKPPLYMPTWKNELSNEDINAVLAYLLSISEYDDGEINAPEIKQAKMEIPVEYETALSFFEELEDIRFKYKTGNYITLGIFTVDLIIIIPFFYFYYFKGLKKGEKKE